MQPQSRPIVLGVIGNPLKSSRWEVIRKLLTESEFETEAFDSDDDSEFQERLRRAQYVVVGGKPITKKHLLVSRQLKLIQVVSNQVENIDLNFAKKKGVPVAVMPFIHLAGVAEHALMFMLALSHKLLEGHDKTVKGGYLALGLTPTLTNETSVAHNWMNIGTISPLFGKHLGIIGMGEIGRFMVRQGHGFNMNISYFKRHRLQRGFEQSLGIEYRDFVSLLRESDFVVPVMPHTPDTEKMFGEREFASMKPSAFFINCSRGGIVDQQALYRALKNRIISGAGLDVYEKEPVPADDPILKLDNLVCTSHIAGTMEILSMSAKMICENIFRVQRGDVPCNLSCG